MEQSQSQAAAASFCAALLCWLLWAALPRGLLCSGVSSFTSLISYSFVGNKERRPGEEPTSLVLGSELHMHVNRAEDGGTITSTDSPVHSFIHSMHVYQALSLS